MLKLGDTVSLGTKSGLRVLAFDPGETTGWALLDHGEIEGGDFPMWSRVEELIQANCPDAVVVEAFRLQGDTAHRLIWSSFPPVEVIGVIKFLCEKGRILLATRPASVAKVFEIRSIIGFSKHAYDAARHGIAYLRQKGELESYRQYIVRPGPE